MALQEAEQHRTASRALKAANMSARPTSDRGIDGGIDIGQTGTAKYIIKEGSPSRRWPCWLCQRFRFVCCTAH
jgi:hypothetical protein